MTAIELMPVATFPGERGWGYDGLYTFAPHPAYGGPDGLARLVDAAHAEGLGVILDVVYNHVGPGNEALTRVRAVLHRPSTRRSGATRSTTSSAACASGRSRTPSSGCATTTSTGCGSTPCTRSSTTRRRTSAPSSPSACAMRARARSSSPRWRSATGGRSRSGATTRSGRRARTTSCTCCSPASRTATTRASARSRALADDLQGAGHDPRRLVVCAQNHDQVGNRAARRPAAAGRAARRRCGDALLAVHAAALHGRGVLRAAPFQFFTDHIDPAIAEATREGRKQEFAAFSSFCGRGRPRPAGRRDVPALEARRRASRIRSTASCSRCAASCRATLEVVEANEEAKRLHAAARRRRARRRLPRAAASRFAADGRLARPAVPARPDLGRQRHELRALLGERRARRALPLRRAGSRDARRARASAPRSTGTATSRASARASATATASTARTTRRPGSASTRTSC